ncbi:MAG: hypothetical protein IPM24_14005 [Bryobacterales bacterium]|nr:hypothetical protein [Bryobacterales bacterium]
MADIAIFDPERINDRATFESRTSTRRGVRYVVVNGKIVLDQGKHTGARPGAVLYGPGKTR